MNEMAAIPAGARIYVAGHRGMVGSAIVRALQLRGHEKLITRSHAELDLRDQAAVQHFMARERPQYVFLAAAKVGGIHANNVYRGEFLYDNLIIQANVIHAAWRNDVERLLFLGSSCIYPRDCPQPIREEYLLTGPLEETNRPYAIAKISGIEMCWSYNRQYGTRYAAVMPTNLYGPGDNYHPQNSHVIPALIRRAHECKVNGASEFSVWGSGTPRREFLYSDDMADACVWLMNLPDAEFNRLMSDSEPPLVNIGTGSDMTIAELARTVCATVGFDGPITFDASKPDGTPRKLLDVSRMSNLGWRASTPFNTGLGAAYRDFLEMSHRSQS